LTVADNPDQPSVLGWHTEGPQDVIYGYIFAAPILDNGGAVLGQRDCRIRRPARAGV
jgi:hypothetical protein